jgi:hypothetical protein
MDTWIFETPSVGSVHYEQNIIASTIFAGFYNETADLIDDLPSEQPPLPDRPHIANNPNPFNSGTFIHYSGAHDNHPAIIRIYDIQGRQVMQITGTNKPSGTVYWTGKDIFNNALASGIYLYMLDNGPVKANNKMLLIK